jgi:hypothetical protein
MIDNRSPLMKRLAEIMPKKPETRWEGKSMMRIDMHPIRQSAEAFASWIHDDLPANREELRAMLWTFGEILNGHMERMLNDEAHLCADLLATLPMPPQTFQLSEEEAAKLSKDWPGIRVEAGLYRFTSGKALKDCKDGDPITEAPYIYLIYDNLSEQGNKAIAAFSSKTLRDRVVEELNGTRPKA